MSIQRYTFYASPVNDEAGELVLFTDHAAEVERLMAERDALKRELDLSRVETAGATTLRLRQRRLYTALAERDAAVARAEKAEEALLEIGRLPYCDAYMSKGLARAALSPEPWGGPEGEE